jgi:signal transduction histidine kinase
VKRAASGKPEPDLLKAHRRFARAAMAIYLGTAGVAVVLLVATVTADRAHEREWAQETLSLETQVRAHALGRHLELLAREINRLGLRSEVDLLDDNMEPERSLLRLTHERSAFFNVGVAILGSDGAVLWSEPQTFLATGLSHADDKLFGEVRHAQSAKIYPASADSHKASILYVASPVLRGGAFTGALVGAIDLALGRTLEGATGGGSAPVALATREGEVIFPPGPPAFASDPDWKSIPNDSGKPFALQVPLAGRMRVVAGAPVEGTRFVLLSLADAHALFAPAEARFGTRLLLGLSLTAIPMLLLVLMLRRSLRVFRKSEEEALVQERLRSLGEAADLIAHEVKNSLNGIQVGLDLVLRAPDAERRSLRALAGLRAEIERLTRFTSELLAVSKGVVPRPVRFELSGFVTKIIDLFRDRAESQGVVLETVLPRQEILVRADPALVHVVIANLLGNALDFLGEGGSPESRVTIRVEGEGALARVQVDDNGPGVARAIRPKLFEPFVTGKPSGVGIGLAYSRRIARAHGGDLTLLDAAAGARFLLTLPLEAL